MRGDLRGSRGDLGVLRANLRGSREDLRGSRRDLRELEAVGGGPEGVEGNLIWGREGT